MLCFQFEGWRLTQACKRSAGNEGGEKGVGRRFWKIVTVDVIHFGFIPISLMLWNCVTEWYFAGWFEDYHYYLPPSSSGLRAIICAYPCHCLV